jgi:hypothetical protein
MLSFTDRIETSALISLVGLLSLANYSSMDKDWLSGHLLFGALFLFSLVCSIIVLLPAFWARFAITLCVIFHFAGMAVTITSIDPPSAQGPWVSKTLWFHVYRPYLSFLYLTNAYHFYSPDPGSPSLFWFAVHFDDGTYSWVKHPERTNSPIGMHYQRMLALPEHSFNPSNQYPSEDIARRRRVLIDFVLDVPTGNKGEAKRQVLPMPVINDIDTLWQYREPTVSSKKMIKSVARRIFHTTPPPTGAKVRSVKVYRVTHAMLTPQELAQGISPIEPTKHSAYFLGEFDGQGDLLKDESGNDDPYLYWYLPIVRVPASYPNHGGTAAGVPIISTRVVPAKDFLVLNCLEMHAAGPARKKPEENKQ